MKNFKNLSQFRKYLENVLSKEKIHTKAILEVMTRYVEDKAKSKFGLYQESAGPFAKWQELSPFTQDDRKARGFSPDDPLYRTGDLMHSIHSVVEGNQAAVGSNDDIMIYQELGTADSAHPIPPRPVLGPAAFESKAKLMAIAKDGVSAWLQNKSPIKHK